MNKRQRALVIGDIMIDLYTHVKTSRNAPEAQIPVWDEVKNEHRLGGAANVAHNLKKLGGPSIDVFVAGIVNFAPLWNQLFAEAELKTAFCVHGETMMKQRFVDEKENIIFRYDVRGKFSRERSEALAELLSGFLKNERFDCIVFSDYDKGTITDEVVNAVSERILRGPDVISVVDSKRKDLSIFQGMDLLKLNELEHSRQRSSDLYRNIEDLFEHVVVTMGSKGAELREQVEQIGKINSSHDNERIIGTETRYIVNSEHFPVESAIVRDVTGCGDTHTAAMALSLLKNPGDMRRAVRFANGCARDVVQKFGTSVAKDRDV